MREVFNNEDHCKNVHVLQSSFLIYSFQFPNAVGGVYTGFEAACKGPNPDPKPSICPGVQCPHVPASNAKGCYIDHTDGLCDLPYVVLG